MSRIVERNEAYQFCVMEFERRSRELSTNDLALALVARKCLDSQDNHTVRGMMQHIAQTIRKRPDGPIKAVGKRRTLLVWTLGKR